MYQVKANKITSVLVSVLLISSILMGCNAVPNAEQATALDTVATTEIISEPTTEIIPALEVTTEPLTQAISTIDLKALENDIDQLSIAISTAGDSEIQDILDTFMSETSWEASHIFYGDFENNFWSSPIVEVPPGYKYTERPVYVNAVETGLYTPELYDDFLLQKYIQTLSKPIIVDGKVIGVIGIDVIN